MTWQVPRCFEGRTVAVLASGPSMSLAVADKVRASNIPTVVVNSTFRLAPWAWMLYAADPEWWLHKDNRDALEFDGLKVSCQFVKGMHLLRQTGTTGFDPDPGAVRTGSNSGYQALHVASHTGASTVLLCGFDMREVKGLGHEKHWHADHPQGLRSTDRDLFPEWSKRFDALGLALAHRGVQVLNCTPNSAITCFQMRDLEEVLRSLQSKAM